MARGSAKGERRGGRKVGTPNKKTAALIAKVEEGGQTPLDFLLMVMRGEMKNELGEPELVDFATRFEAAKAAAPYVHAKRTHLQGDGPSGAIVVHLVGDDAKL